MAWQFWIDVGGTFTDCLARKPDGTLLRHKLLSSGVTKGQIERVESEKAIVDSARQQDPPHCWRGYEVRLLDEQGEILATTRVTAFDAESGTLSFQDPLSPQPGQRYELFSDEEAPIQGLRYLYGIPRDEPIPNCYVRLGTTRGTNALITRSGAKTAFVTTKGFADILKIGYQNRPHLFQLEIEKPSPLESLVVEIAERIGVDGEVLLAPDAEHVRQQLAPLQEQGIESLAVCLLHGAFHADHEKLIGQIATELGFEELSLSHEVAPLIKIVARGDTTVMDAYLNPILREYVQKLRASLGQSELRMMTSAGGLVRAEAFVGKDSLLSGPAGGVVGFSQVAKTAGFTKAIGFDMGGTSTDVSRFDGRWQYEFETEKAGVRVVAPMLAIETVAAGGGSVCYFDEVKLAVGPASAGADPGPACYGRGGPLTVTDINFFLGKILPEHFPFPLDRAAVERRLDDLIQIVQQQTGKQYTRIELADGFLRIANANMVKPIRSISIAKGYDPREYVLVCFGGAAAQHACAIARELGQTKVLNHPDAGILSAYGMGVADITRHREQGIYAPCTAETMQQVEAKAQPLIQAAREEILAEGIAAEQIESRQSLDLRYVGLDAYLTIEEPTVTDPQAKANAYQTAYEEKHRQLYGYVQRGKSIEVGALRIEVIGHTPDPTPEPAETHSRTPEPQGQTTGYFQAQAHTMAVYGREQLQPGDEISGPALIYEQVATTVIDPGWKAEVLSRGELLLTDHGEAEGPADLTSQDIQHPDPVLLEVFNNQFAGIAEQMGITLRNTSSSVNVKERLDFSCALFTPEGDLVVNAPHIPVHLGAMSLTVQAIIADNPNMQPGDVFVTNDPYRGGSHLPDVTVVTPVHDSQTQRVLFFTASRAHHAELGGIVPGSMPPFSKNLAEEGVLIQNFKLVAAGEERMEAFRQLLTAAPWPTRRVEENLADVQAQVAANQQGVRDLTSMIERYGLEMVEAYMHHIQQAAETKLRKALARLPDGTNEFVDHLDDGSAIQVRVTISGEDAEIDFTGTGAVLPGNLNANRAIVRAAVMYCLRLLIDEEIPLNAGVLNPVKILVPAGLLNPPAGDTPEESPAVVGGNVETSQRVVDVVLGAFGLAAASQGTMNNLTFGDGSFGYYETICGGVGATQNSSGADAVHTHMTNTRLTDPEVFEKRYPVRLHQFAIREHSGGAGKHPGGCGVIRKIEFLKPLDVAILSQRRGDYPPYGLVGGSPGALGKNTLLRADGTEEPLAGQAQFQVQPGDLLLIETPGGGGWGSAS